MTTRPDWVMQVFQCVHAVMAKRHEKQLWDETTEVKCRPLSTDKHHRACPEDYEKKIIEIIRKQVAKELKEAEEALHECMSRKLLTEADVKLI